MKENFEKLIEYIINDEKEKAQELFHQYVVSQSREIYNELVAEDEMTEEEKEEDEDDGEEMDESIVDEYSADEADDMMSDISADEEGMDQEDDAGADDMEMGSDEAGEEEGGMEGDEDLEGRVVDLEDALDELKAEFDRLMADEAGEEEHSDMPEEGVVREYHEKVNVSHSDGTDSKGAKSTVAGKNDMGGSAKNIAQGGEEKGASTPKSGDMGAVDPRAAGKTAFAKKAPAAVSKDQAAGTKSPVA